jgi:ABC-type polysaccharide/polyol phosphate export permease
MGLLITILMVLSPIAFTPDMLPAALRPLIWLNPFAYFVLAYQQLLIFGKAPEPSEMLLITAIALGCFVGGHALFVRVKAIVVDYA